MVTTAWPATELNEARALQDDYRARAALEALTLSATELQGSINGRKVVVVLMADHEMGGSELCRVSESKVTWSGGDRST